MEYIIIAETKLSILELRVNERLKMGWQLQGGVAASAVVYIQAMIKKEKK